MRGKGTLSLLEQSLMLLIFALATALCLKGFLAAELTAEKNAALDEAVIAQLRQEFANVDIPAIMTVLSRPKK